MYHVSLSTSFLVISVVTIITLKAKQYFKKINMPKKPKPSVKKVKSPPEDLYADRDPPERGTFQYYLSIITPLALARGMICIVLPTILLTSINNPWLVILPMIGTFYAVGQTGRMHRKIMALSEEDYKKKCRLGPIVYKNSRLGPIMYKGDIISPSTDPTDHLYNIIGPGKKHNK